MRWKFASLLTLLLTGAVWALGVTSDPAGNLYQFWTDRSVSGEVKSILKYSKSIDQGSSFGQAIELFGFTFEVNACDLVFGASDQLLAAAWEKDGSICYSRSEDGGINWNDPAMIQVTGEVLNSPAVAIDNLNHFHLVFLSEDKNLNLKRLYYTSLSSLEPKVIFKSQDDLAHPKLIPSPWGMLITWQKKYLDRSEFYLANSLDQGKHFGEPRAVPFESDPLWLGFYGNNWIYFTNKSSSEAAPYLTLKNIDFPLPPTPELYRTHISSLEISYNLGSPAPLMGRIEISWDRSFPPDKSYCFEQLNVSGSPEVSYQLPVELPEGDYFMRLSAFDGLASSFPTLPIEFRIDRTPPALTLLSPTAEVIDQKNLLLTGKVSEAADLHINNFKVTAEADGTFKVKFSLQPGKNLIEITATDEAGNTAHFSKTILYSAIRPEIILLKPKETDWFKPDSTIYIEAEARDPQNDITDEAEGEIVISGAVLEDRLIYDKNEAKLSGFIRLPQNMQDGKLSAGIKLNDAAGNVGEAAFNINIDRTAPALGVNHYGSHLALNTVFSNSSSSVGIPITDAGAGVDPAGTIIMIAGVSTEGFASLEAEKLIVKTKFPLPDGSYEAEAIPRDLIGNTGNISAFCLIVDTIPPALFILSSAESSTDQSSLLINGLVNDSHSSVIKIYNNQELIESFIPQENIFTKEIQLFPGNNEILVEAIDQAGNKSGQFLRTFANIHSFATLITDCKNYPNPFSPRNDRQMYFTFNFSSAADIKIYIFDLIGNLIWKKEFNNIAAGNVPWNGFDQFGAAVGNGIYPYLLQASSGGTVEIKRGKIIVLKP